jgi:hypothetical protein
MKNQLGLVERRRLILDIDFEEHILNSFEDVTLPKWMIFQQLYNSEALVL